MKTMIAKYPGECRGCTKGIKAGEEINFHGKGVSTHTGCQLPEGTPTESAYSRMYSNRSRGRRSTFTRFSSGAVIFQNSRGRCEDAPCCGCCS